MFLVVTIHFAYFRRTQLVTRIFIMFCIAIFFFQLLSFIDTLAASSASTDGCTALGILLHLTMIAQFIWLLALVRIWAIETTPQQYHTHSKYTIFVLGCLGLA